MVGQRTARAASTKIIECFSEEHPVYQHQPIPGNHFNVPSSTKTQQAVLPRYFLDLSHLHYIRLADTHLRSSQATSSSQLKVRSIASTERRPAMLRTEADVVMTAMLYLLDPIGKVIDAKYTESISRASEVSQDKCRLDFSYNIEADDPNKKPRPVMIVEFKKCGYVRWHDFSPSIIKNTAKDIKEADKSMKRQGTVSTWQGPQNGAYWYSKQAAAYAEEYGCDYVALCDYNSLVLLHFEDNRTKVNITNIPRRYMRLGLLGFLIAACNAMNIR